MSVVTELSNSTEAPSSVPPRRWVTAAFLLFSFLSLGSYYLWLYSSCLDRFFFLDDYWVLNEAQSISIRSPLDVWQFFRPVPFFLLYRPLTTLGYFYALRHFFDHDPTAYHATQLAFNVFNAMLVCGIGTVLFRSRFAGFATGLAYASAPGHAVASCWIATFTMTGTAFFYFLGLLAWLRRSSRWRTPITAALFVTALLASEHAISFPVTLTLIACLAQGERDWRKLVREQGIFYAIAVVYGCIKLTYLWMLSTGFLTGDTAFKASVAAHSSYAVHFDPYVALHNLGYYLDFSWSPLYARGLSKAWPIALGAALVCVTIAATVLVIMNSRTDLSLRVATLGLNAYYVTLGPVFLLRDHLVDYYVGIAGLGTSLAIVGLARAVRPISTVAVATVVAILALTNALSAGTLARRQQDFALFYGGSETAKGWLYAIAKAVQRDRVQEVVIPRTDFTRYMFQGGHAHRTLLCARYRVRLSDKLEVESARPGSVLVPNPQRVPEPHVRRARWSWLRAACARERERPPPTPG